MLQVPVPPVPKVAPVNVNEAPAQTVVTFGDLVADGAVGSVVTVQV